MKWPCRREPQEQEQEQEAAGKRLKKAIDKAMDDAGIKPGFPDDDDGEPEDD